MSYSINIVAIINLPTSLDWRNDAPWMIDSCSITLMSPSVSIATGCIIENRCLYQFPWSMMIMKSKALITFNITVMSWWLISLATRLFVHANHNKASKARITASGWGESTGRFPSQRAWQIVQRLKNSKPEFRGFEISRVIFPVHALSQHQNCSWICSLSSSIRHQNVLETTDFN